jgi:hypothetical protein
MIRLVVIGLLTAAFRAGASDFFSEKIEPLLKNRCYECHSHAAGKMKGGLTLDSKSGWEQGGDSGPTLVPGRPEESLLMKVVRWTDDDHQMPPKQPLPADEVALLEQWVATGAPDPRLAVAVEKPGSAEGDWWSLRPLVKPTGPAAAGNPLDGFIQAALTGRGLQPSPPADRRTLIRRVGWRRLRKKWMPLCRARIRRPMRCWWIDCWLRLGMASVGRGTGWIPFILRIPMAMNTTFSGPTPGDFAIM